MFYLKVYTRAVSGYRYPTSLANSIHFSYSYDGEYYAPLNQNYGILFAKAEISDKNTILERGLLLPEIYQKEDGSESFLIEAEYVDQQGRIVYPDQRYYWKTNNFLDFEELGLAKREMAEGWVLQENQIVRLSSELGIEIRDAWLPLSAEEVLLPDSVTIRNVDELKKVKARIRYSDGSFDEKNVEWKLPGEWNERAEEQNLVPIKGTIKTKKLPYPLAVGYADPVIFQWEDAWYFLATNDNLGNVGLFIRKAESEEGLFDERAVERCILFYNEDAGWIQTFWAPEFHVIGEEAYILFAVGGKQWAPQCHMMKLKKGGDLLEPSAWEKPIRVCLKNGEPLTTEGISLDMTYVEAGGKHYVIWSYRFQIGTPGDTGSMLYIATIDARKPWQLTSDPVLLSRPLYGWENIQGTINNEGPYALKAGGKIYLAYSGGAAVGYSYAVGYLIAEEGADLLDIRNWKKHPCPVLSYYSVGIDGPGHNSFYVSEEGKMMVAYHGQLHVRCAAIHRVHFNKKGFPLLNMSLERDVPEHMRKIEMDVQILS